MYCPNCGYKNDDDADFCEQCGNRLEPEDGYKPSSGGKRGSRVIAALAVVLCVGIMGILVYLLVLSPEKENDTLSAEALFKGSDSDSETEDISEEEDTVLDVSEETETEETASDIGLESTEKSAQSKTPTPTPTATPTQTPLPTVSAATVPTPVATATPVPTAAAATSDYIIPDSSSRLVSRTEIEKLSDEDLRLAINEIYARNGRKFQSEELQIYFNTKSWYHPSVEAEDFKESMLNDIEKQNVMLMAEIQNSRAQ